MLFCWYGLVLDHPVPIGATVHDQLCWVPSRTMWGGRFAVNNQKCLSMVSFCSRTKTHVIPNVMCKIWRSCGAGRCWHTLPSVQISPHMIDGCLHVWKNVFRVKDLNRKTISILHSQPLSIVSARMNTELQLIFCNIDIYCARELCTVLHFVRRKFSQTGAWEAQITNMVQMVKGVYWYYSGFFSLTNIKQALRRSIFMNVEIKPLHFTSLSRNFSTGRCSVFTKNFSEIKPIYINITNFEALIIWQFI